MTYAEHVDAGRFDDVAAMFEHSTYRIEHGDGVHVSSYEGSAPVKAFCEQTRLYPDGTPRTRHVITNVVIDVDGDRAGRAATRRSSSRPTCCRSNRSRQAATSTSSNGSAARGGSPTASSPGSSSGTAASTSCGTTARRMPRVSAAHLIHHDRAREPVVEGRPSGLHVAAADRVAGAGRPALHRQDERDLSLQVDLVGLDVAGRASAARCPRRRARASRCCRTPPSSPVCSPASRASSRSPR